ncbi:MAG: DNA polymerase III subunit alpha, partial [Firmicutes bacterium]|nr:DNA polymerase III subunit alpha [Bacillota bacterium]
SEEEMRELFSDIPEACDNTQIIADRCNVEFTFGEYHLPEFIPPEGLTNKEYLRHLCYEGLSRRYGSDAMDEGSDLRQRLESELQVIESMGYVEYFLIVWDFIHYAKTKGIPVGPGRGSAAGSIVSYCLDITEIDPIKYNLIFERFLNPERVSMPDIDVDFCIERRQEVIDYVIDKYGKDKVSQIITFGTLKAKAAVRDVGRALNATYAEADALAKAIPNDLGITIAKALEINPELRSKYEREPLARNILDMSMALEGLPRHASTHAAGIVISKLPLDEYVPLYSSDKGLATQFNMTTIEELGLLKMDFLGLRNLTVINEALQMIEQNHGVRIDLSTMGYDDPEVYKMIAEGNTKGVFQLESPGMTDFMKNLKPTCFEDVVAGISLYRPGPMDSIPKYIENKKHPENVKYIDPHLEPILGVTYGCLVYQEQVMQIVRDLGGYSYGRSDLVRRAMSKKKMQVMLEEKEYFIHGKKNEDGSTEIAGCIANGIPEAAAEAIFEDMVTFAQYAFNKSHAAAYAVVAYETAYLKRHYPVEFMAALLSSVSGDGVHTADYIRNCREMGIDILPPSVLKSGRGYLAKDGKIRFGLLSVKSVGTGIADAIARAQSVVPETDDIYEFIRTIDAGELNRKAIESLIKAGAFDDINSNRAQCMAVCDDAVKTAQKMNKASNTDQISLFDIDEEMLDEVRVAHELPKVSDFSLSQKLALEKEVLGVYISGHPLDEYRTLIEENITARTSELISLGSDDESFSQGQLQGRHLDGDRVLMAGMLENVKKMLTKDSKEMARISLEDLDGVIGGIVFSRTFEKCRHILKDDEIVGVLARISMKEEGQTELIVEDVAPVGELPRLKSEVRGSYMRRRYQSQGQQGEGRRTASSPQVRSDSSDRNYLKLRLTEEAVSAHGDLSGAMYHILDVLSMYPGETEVLVYLPDGRMVRADSEHRACCCGELRTRLERILGAENVKG